MKPAFEETARTVVAQLPIHFGANLLFDSGALLFVCCGQFGGPGLAQFLFQALPPDAKRIAVWHDGTHGGSVPRLAAGGNNGRRSANTRPALRT